MLALRFHMMACKWVAAATTLLREVLLAVAEGRNGDEGDEVDLVVYSQVCVDKFGIGFYFLGLFLGPFWPS